MYFVTPSPNNKSTNQIVKQPNSIANEIFLPGFLISSASGVTNSIPIKSQMATPSVAACSFHVKGEKGGNSAN
ncbi:hypothetical protein [Aneurinibacillus aneurinilyticus]|nr:hypothetical protein [Aneurinibacillus aneurinilyticus]